FSLLPNNTSPTTFLNVMDYGAVGNGKTDDTQAFSKAWAKACGSSSPIVLNVPSNMSFLLNHITFQGPCKPTSITIQILGTILAPNEISAWKSDDKEHWMTFDSINSLTLNGSGQINGQGSSWWECREKNKCSEAPNAVAINNCNNTRINDLNFVDSPMMHIALNDCFGANISGITIMAPKDSPNTDGIHLEGTKQVRITNSTIGTGDDCISIGTQSSNINISHIFCGPGHGISVGSLGKDEESAVEEIFVSNCNFSDTMNGVRIKTWQGGSGFAKSIRFEHIVINSTDNPIIIDQYYCNDGHNCPNKTSAVKLSDVSFRDINGTSSKETAINLACSETVACTGIHLEHVHLTSATKSKQAASACKNAKGMSLDVIPPVECLD
ncbi:hypothetical protein AQUCO_00500511v1, partial [Aquilegia coerulea]